MEAKNQVSNKLYHYYTTYSWMKAVERKTHEAKQNPYDKITNE